MKTPTQSIVFGSEKYYDVYTEAINEFWQHDKIIAGMNVEDWFVAQATQESRFNARAISPVGACGIAQFMSKTGLEVARELKHHEMFKDGFERINAIQSIYAQVYYMNKLFNMWIWKRSATSKMQLALASYNAGIGNILNAQKASGNKKHWIELEGHLKKITGHHSKETIIYVSNICNFALIVQDLKHNK